MVPFAQKEEAGVEPNEPRPAEGVGKRDGDIACVFFTTTFI
jgi:hypothetical protein